MEEFVYVWGVYGTDYGIEKIKAKDVDKVYDWIEETRHNMESGIVLPLAEFKELIKDFDE